MLTTTPTAVSFTTVPSHYESLREGSGDCGPSPEEIYRRVREIRASWGLEERIARRREAQNRFENLVEALCGGHAA
ncbi:hypothetical protein [Candidatus Laterigemmans baculatus]|uniref:hypothetical protein n=1 Tax=Candidatus Laterigemmans baculatus TaxID=2770505 RepID=UPI0013DA2BC7|nr:hypothetical protein [Candidatus Laterigemmans baculatus]